MSQATEIRSRDAAARCDYYRDLCGIPAEVCLEDSERVVLPIGGGIGAVVMTEDLGRSVLVHLRAHQVGPVIEHTRARRWTFLCAPRWVPHDLAEQLVRAGIEVVQHGHVVVLPSVTDELSRFRLWVQHPGQHQPLPPMPVLLDALRAVTSQATFRRWAGEEPSWTAMSHP